MYLPTRLRAIARRAEKEKRARAEELRFRVGREATVLLSEGEISLGTETVTKQELDMILEISTGASFYSAIEQIRSGYITVRGGHRIGLCGTAAVRDGRVTGFSALTSVSLRIAKEIKGVSDDILEDLAGNGRFCSTLIISPPGGGKTTLLRDILRNLSDGSRVLAPKRVSLADERGEVASQTALGVGMDVGRHTDILSGCRKDVAAMMLLRAMNPEIIALDEITAPEDIEAMVHIRNCGVELIATAHAAGMDDLRDRPLYRKMLEDGLFSRFVIIEKTGNGRVYRVERREDCA